MMKSERIEKNHYVYRQGEPAKGLYIVFRGSFLLQKETKLEVDSGVINFLSSESVKQKLRALCNKQYTLDLTFLTPGSVFGEEELLKLKSREFSVKSVEQNSEILKINKYDLVERVLKDTVSIRQYLRRTHENYV